MVVVPVDHGAGRVEVDLCGACRGVWLDRGEESALKIAPLATDRAGTAGITPLVELLGPLVVDLLE